MAFHPVCCQRCFKVIDFKDAEFVDSSTGYQAYCTDCIEAILVDEELKDDPGFDAFLDHIDKQGEDSDKDCNGGWTE
jgi:hypothetical protein